MNLMKKSMIVAVSSLFVAGMVGCGEREERAAAPGESPTARTEPATPSTPATPPLGAGPSTEQRDTGAGGTAAAPGGMMDDATITAKVKSAFVAEPDLSAMQINVDTKDGTVTLTGQVDSEQKKDRAAQIAQGQEGVKSVENQLTVKAGG